MSKYLQYETLFETKKGFVYYDRKSKPKSFLVAIENNPDAGYFETFEEAKRFLQLKTKK